MLHLNTQYCIISTNILCLANPKGQKSMCFFMKNTSNSHALQCGIFAAIPTSQNKWKSEQKIGSLHFQKSWGNSPLISQQAKKKSSSPKTKTHYCTHTLLSIMRTHSFISVLSALWNSFCGIERIKYVILRHILP